MSGVRLSARRESGLERRAGMWARIQAGRREAGPEAECLGSPPLCARATQMPRPLPPAFRAPRLEGGLRGRARCAAVSTTRKTWDPFVILKVRALDATKSQPSRYTVAAVAQRVRRGAPRPAAERAQVPLTRGSGRRQARDMIKLLARSVHLQQAKKAGQSAAPPRPSVPMRMLMPMPHVHARCMREYPHPCACPCARPRARPCTPCARPCATDPAQFFA